MAVGRSGATCAGAGICGGTAGAAGCITIVGRKCLIIILFLKSPSYRSPVSVVQTPRPFSIWNLSSSIYCLGNNILEVSSILFFGCRLSHRMGKAELRYSIEPFASLRAKIAAWLARRRGLFTGNRASIKVSTGFDQRTRSQ
jgi:hypothetical protein